MRYIFILLLISNSCCSQDQVLESLDSLSRVYYYNKLEFEKSTKEGNSLDIIRCSDQEYSARFMELNKNFPFTLVYNKRVKTYIDYYLTHYKSISTIKSNTQFYFPKYEQYLIKYSLPLELKYLSVIESALNPTAKSYCGAAGLWQFMPMTGKAYGLNITSFQDDRYNIYQATEAACKYLKDLHAIYNDWMLALAAYNCGPGNVNKAIKRAGGKQDFFSIIEYLPKETQGYVPAFMAVTYVLNYFSAHNIPEVKSKLAFTEIDSIRIKRRTSIQKLSEILSIPSEQLKYLNPSYYTGIIPGNNDLIYIPLEKAITYIDKEIQINGQFNLPTVLSTPKKEEIPKKDPFGTIEVSSINKGLKISAKQNDVIVCEVINDFYSQPNEILKIRNLKSFDSIPANSLLLGKMIYKDNKKLVNIYMVANTNRSINYYTDIFQSLKEGETIYLKNN